nr:integrase, catalytic region, zinc finger, CCHC-type, peptidase aspartic, catalytic [Tanacetum cinerariifolium]
MLDRTDFASWKQRIRLYCQGKENGVNILKSIDEGPYQMGIVQEPLIEGTEGAPYLGLERPRVYSDLSPKEKDQYNADIRHKGETNHDYYVWFAKLINDMRNIKMTMSRMQLNSKFVNNMLPEWGRLVTVVKLNRGLRDSNYDQLGQGMNLQGGGAAGYGGVQNRVGNANPDQARQDLALNVDNVFQVDDCDAFDSDVDEAPTAKTMFMANLSSADPVTDEARPSYDSDILSEIQDHDHYQDAVCTHHEEHAMHDSVQLNHVVDSHADYMSDSNMISYDQYVKDSEVPVVYSNVSFVSNDAYMMIYNDMYEPHAQSVSNTSRNTVVENSLTAELATYKEQVELYERRAKFKLTKREQKINEQLRLVISNYNFKEETLKKELHSIKLQLASTINHNKSMVEEVTFLKKDFKQNENNYLEDFLDMKSLKEKVEDRLLKQNQSLQTIHMLCRPNPYYNELTKARCLELEAELANLRDKSHHEKVNSVSKDHVKPKVLARGKYAIDVKPIVPRLRNNRDAHLDYLKNLKESVETIRDIEEEAKVVRPLDRSIIYACRYTKHSQELLEYAIGTCPQDSQQRDKQLSHIHLIRKKQVTFAKPSDQSNSNTYKHVAKVNTQKTNVPVPPSIGVNSCPNASGSQPRSNTKKNKISPAKGVNKLPVEDQPKTNKYHLRTSNRIDSSSLLKRIVVQIVLWYLDSGCLKYMMGDRSRLMNFVKKFIRTVRFRNNRFGAIMGYRDYVIGDSVISKVYYVEGLGHNLFSIGQFCDSYLEGAFRKHSCYVRDTDGVELIKGSRGSNLYTISIEDIMKSSLICLLSKASENKSWLWHQRLNHLNFDTINDLARKDLVRGLPRLKFEKIIYVLRVN